jgi:hypothetical protein
MTTGEPRLQARAPFARMRTLDIHPGVTVRSPRIASAHALETGPMEAASHELCNVGSTPAMNRRTAGR